MFIIDDLLLALIGRLVPLSKTTPTMIMHWLAKRGVANVYSMPKEIFYELAEPIIEKARAVAARNKFLGGETRVHAWVLILVENETADIACVLRGKSPKAMDVVENGFTARITAVFERHGVKVPPASTNPPWIDALDI